MLGLGGEMALAYFLCILAALLCVIYGLVKWNDMGRCGEDLEEKIEWERRERRIREKLP